MPFTSYAPSLIDMMNIYHTLPIVKKLPYEIECIHAYDDQLIVGTKQGYLLVYKLVPKRNPETQRIEKFDVSIIRSNKNFSKKPITQIEALPDFEIFLSLSDNQVSVHSLTEYSSALTCSLLSSKSRGALMFVTNVTRYKGLTGDRTPVLRLCVALKRKLLIFYWKNGDFHELAPDLSIPDVPKSISWVGESLFVGFRGEYTLIKVTGEQKELFAVGKHPEPMVAAIENHKLLALGRDDKTYILDNEGKPVLSYDISWSDIPQCMTDDPPYLLCLLPNSSVEIQTMEPRISIQKIAMDTSLSSAALKVKRILSCVNRPGHIFAFSSSDILCLVAIPLQQQISQMLKENHFDLAKKLADLTRRDSTSSSSREDSGQFHQTESDQEDTIKKIDQLHAYHLFCKKEFKESMNLFSKLDTDPVVVINLFPDLIPVSSRSKIDYPSPLPTLNAQELKAGLTALIDFLLPVRRNLAAKDSKPVGSTLAKNRPHLRQIVDTTLLKCYLHTSDALVASLLRLPDNNCHVEESEEALLKFNKLNELIILYQSKGMHRKALDMLTSHCRVSQLKKETDSPSTSPSRGFSHDRVIKYLQHLGPDQLDLIFEYSEWIIREHPEDGLRIFTEDFGSDTEHLPRQKVVEFFERINPTLTIPYLEHVIENWKDTSPTLHNLLLYKYRERVTHLLPEYLHSLPEGHSPASPGQEPGELGIMRGKLLKLLQDSSCYSTEVLPAHFLKDGLWDERAVVMGKIGEHREALSIYICQLNDADKAENYCRRVYETSSSPGSKEVFLTLLKLFLSPPPETPQLLKGQSSVSNLSAAISLLNKYPKNIDPVQAMTLLPPETPMQAVSQFLKVSCQRVQHDRRWSQMFRNLLLSQHMVVQGKRIQHQQAHKVTIEESDICQFCQKKIGKSAFIRFPHNTHLVHYGCMDSCKDRLNDRKTD